MIIECFALPEVGKSTIIENLKKEYGVKSIPQEYSNKKGALFFFLRQPFSTAKFVFILLKEGFGNKGGWKIIRFKLSVFISTISRLEKVNDQYSDEEIVIIDEGIVQRLLSLYETKQPAERYVSILKKMPLADSVLFLEYKGESDRIKNGRVGTMRRSINDEYTEAWRSTMLHNYNSLVTALKSTNLVNVSYSRDDNIGFDLSLIMKDLENRRDKYCKNGK